MKSNSEARPSTVFLFLLYVHFYNFTAAGIWVSWNLKLMNYPTETEHEAMGQTLVKHASDDLSSN